jgi:hypothetical protein
MTATRAGGPSAYVAAHRISTVDGRMSFEQAYCLAKLVFDHAGGPVVPERIGSISLKLCKALAAENLVMLTGEMNETMPAIVRLTVTASFLEELGHLPEQTVVVEGYNSGRRQKRVDWFVEVTQEGLDLVASAVVRLTRRVTHYYLAGSCTCSKSPSSRTLGLLEGVRGGRISLVDALDRQLRETPRPLTYQLQGKIKERSAGSAPMTGARPGLRVPAHPELLGDPGPPGCRRRCTGVDRPQRCGAPTLKIAPGQHEVIQRMGAYPVLPEARRTALIATAVAARSTHGYGADG